MPGSEEQYLDYLEANCGSSPRFDRMSDENVHPPIYLATFSDVPEDGMTTGFTMGLSSIDYPEWKLARPELVISVQSQDMAWGWAVGFIASQARGKYGFCVGETVNFNARISDESELSAFFIFYSSIMDMAQSKLSLPDRTDRATLVL